MSGALMALLGPQRSRITAGAVLRAAGLAGPIAAVTAGWQEREPEDAALNEFFGGGAVNLGLHERAERVWQGDSGFRQAHEALQADLRLLRQSYDLRLRHLMAAWRSLEEMPGAAEVLDPERAAALEAIRTLDRHHLDRVARLRADYQARAEPARHPAVCREREEIAAILETTPAVAIAGGHVAVLLNRLRLFDLAPLLAGKAIVAWSAGAMALSEHVVVFHDSPPQGPGHAEAFDLGLGIAKGVVLLPHASERLRLDDAGRVGRLARRFAPAMCVALDAAQGITLSEGRWVALRGGEGALEGARLLGPDGRLQELAA
jgi:hypothetical protein